MGVNKPYLFVGIIVAIIAVVVTVLLDPVTTDKISASDYGIVLQIIGFVLWLVVNSDLWKDYVKKSHIIYQATPITAIVGGLVMQLSMFKSV